MRGLEGKVQVDDKLTVGLLEDVCLDHCVFQLLLQDQVLFLQGFEGIHTIVGDEPS